MISNHVQIISFFWHIFVRTIWAIYVVSMFPSKYARSSYSAVQINCSCVTHSIYSHPTDIAQPSLCILECLDMSQIICISLNHTPWGQIFIPHELKDKICSSQNLCLWMKGLFLKYVPDINDRFCLQISNKAYQRNGRYILLIHTNLVTYLVDLSYERVWQSPSSTSLAKLPPSLSWDENPPTE